MTSVQKPESGQSEQRVIMAFIKNGPSLRDLDLAVTDPNPLGCFRTTQFEFTKRVEVKGIGWIINAVLRGMTRTGEDEKGFLNNYLWQITGSTRVGRYGSTLKGGINFVIKEYSPITRKGTIYFSVSNHSDQEE